MKNILTEALVNSATNASFIFSYTNSAKLRDNSVKRLQTSTKCTFCTMFVQNIVLVFENHFTDNAGVKRRDTR